MSRPLRQILPKGDGDAQPGSPTTTTRKRDAVALACEKCRTRKSKCDGQRPECTTCRARGTECRYNDDPETTPHANLKRKYRHLEEQQEEFLELFNMLRTRPETEAHTILERLRSSADVHSTLSLIKDGDLLVQTQVANTESSASRRPQSNSPAEALLTIYHPHAYPPLPPLEDEAAELGLKRTSLLEVQPGGPHGFSEDDIVVAKSLDKPHGVCDDRLLRVKAAHWTAVTDNDVIVANLISLYLSWDHATLRIFDEERFLQQIATGDTVYCSPLLVNALLATASLNYRAIDSKLSRSLGPAFFREATRWWRTKEGQDPLLHVPAGILMNMWCNANGKDEMGAQYLSEALQIARDTGLFSFPQATDAKFRHPRKSRAIIAWGLFNFHILSAFFTGPIDDLPNPPYLEIPLDGSGQGDDQSSWDSFPLIRPKQILHRGLAFKAYSELFVAVKDYLTARQVSAAASSPEVAFENVKLLHSRMLAWAADLPLEMLRGPRSLPMVLDLHLFFHGILAKVFRPLAGTASPAQATSKELMQASLAQLRRLLYLQRYRYDGPPFNSTVIGSVHVLTFSLLEELARSKNLSSEATFYLVLCAEAMKKYGQAFPAIHSMLHKLLGSVRDHRHNLPHDLEEIFLDLQARLYDRVDIRGLSRRYPIDFHMAITDPTGSEPEELIRATYNVSLDSGSGSEEESVQADGISNLRLYQKRSNTGSTVSTTGSMR